MNLVNVIVPCSCPGTPHEQDTVSLAAVADVAIGMAMMTAMNAAPARIPEMEAAIASTLLHVAPRAWTFVDEEGPLPLTPENIDERLIWTQGGAEVAEVASGLYGTANTDGVFSPLVQKRLTALRRGQKARSTSPTRTHGSRKRSSGRPSLRTVSDGKPSAAKAS